jgi:hypothetical protein
MSRVRDDIEGAEIEAELQALNDALLSEPRRGATSILP